MLSPGDSVNQSHQGSLRNNALLNTMNNNNNSNKNPVQSSSNLDFDLNYTNSNIASIVAKGSPSSSSKVGSFGPNSGENRQLDVLQKLNNISLNLNEKLKSPLLGEIEFFGHDDADDILGQTKGLNGRDDDEDELDNFEDDHSTDNSLGKGTPDFQQRMMLNHRLSDPAVFQKSSFKNPNAFNIPTASNMNAPEMSVMTGGFTLTNKISSKMVPIEPKVQGADASRSGSVSSNGQNSGPSSRKQSFQGDINNNKNSISPSTMTGTLVQGNITDLTPQNSIKNTPRFQMKLQLMKQQAEQDSRKNGLPSSQSSSANYMANEPSSFVHGTMIPSNVQVNQNYQLTNQNMMNQPENETGSQQNLADGLISTSAEIIPRSLLSQAYQIETKLEYPTKYHVMQLAKSSQSSTDHFANIMAANQLAPSSSQTSIEENKRSSSKSAASRSKTSLKSPMKPSTTKSSSSVSNARQIALKGQIESLSANNSLNDSSSLAGSDIAVIHNGSILSDYVLHENLDSQSFDSHNSNLDLSQLSSPSNSSFSQNDFLNEVDDIDPEELESFLNKSELGASLTNLQLEEEISEIERALNLPKTLPTDEYFRDILSPQSVGKGSSSCPADAVRLKKLQGLNLTEDEIRLIIKDRQKKDNHNMIERRRRFNINDRIKELGTILPKAQNGEIKQNKGSILKASVDYIKNLQHQVNKTKELNDKFIQMSILNRKLMHRIKELELQNGSSNNNLQSSTSTMHSSFTQSQSGQQSLQQTVMAPSYRAPSYDSGAIQMPTMNNRQNSNTHAMSLKDLVIPIQPSQSSAQSHQVNSMPNDLTLQARQNEQLLKQQQQTYFLQQQQQQMQMQMLQQQSSRLYGYHQQEMQAANSPLNFQKNDPLLSTSTNLQQQKFEDTMMEGVN